MAHEKNEKHPLSKFREYPWLTSSLSPSTEMVGEKEFILPCRPNIDAYVYISFGVHKKPTTYKNHYLMKQQHNTIYNNNSHSVLIINFPIFPHSLYYFRFLMHPKWNIYICINFRSTGGYECLLPCRLCWSREVGGESRVFSKFGKRVVFFFSKFHIGE